LLSLLFLKKPKAASRKESKRNRYFIEGEKNLVPLANLKKGTSYSRGRQIRVFAR